MNVVLFFQGLGDRGGISPDVRHLESALGAEGVSVKVTSRFKDLLVSRPGSGTVVNVYGCLPSVKSLGAMLAARARGQRLVWTPVFHPKRREIWKGSGPYRAMAIFDCIAPRLARITHGVSAATDEEAAFFTAMGAPLVSVIPLVAGQVHDSLHGQARVQARQRLGVGDEPVVLIIASHSPRRKGMDFAASVLAEVRKQLPDVTFLVIGGGDLGALTGREGVRAAGWCPDDLLINAYRSADLLFVPSLYEQFSRATIEAWACELPVVMTDGVALARTAEDSRAGVVVPFGDVQAASAALQKALTNKVWRIQAGGRGHDLVDERFRRENHLRATLDLYEAAVR